MSKAHNKDDALVYEIVESLAIENDQLRATIWGMLCGYHVQWKDTFHNKELYLSEAELDGPLVNTVSGRNSRSFGVAGKIDKVVRTANGELVLYDHKTTSQDIEDPNAVYWRQLQVDLQHQHYYLLLWLNGIRVDRIVWDVIRKPAIRPKKLSKAQIAALQANEPYCGYMISYESRVETWTTGRETAEMYGVRVAHEYTSKPEKYLARRTVVRTNDEFAEYCRELWDVSKAILHARAQNAHYKNPSACMQYGSPCVFLGVCSGHDTIESDNWETKERLYPELATQSGELLTNSRVKTWLTCRRKHYYEFELGLERVDAEDRYPLMFGTLYHAALDAYWERMCGKSSQMEEDYGYSDATTAGSEPAVVR